MHSNGLTEGQWLLRLLHGRPDDVGAMNAFLVAELLGFIEPFSSHVPQQVPVPHRLLQVPVHMGDVKRGHVIRFGKERCYFLPLPMMAGARKPPALVSS